MELETDKAVVEVPSSVSGTVKEILVKEGDKIKVGQVVFTADSNGAPAAEAKESPLQQEPAKLVEKAQPAQTSSSASSTTAAAAAKPQPARAAQSESQPAPQPTRSADAPAGSELRRQALA